MTVPYDGTRLPEIGETVSVDLPTAPSPVPSHRSLDAGVRPGRVLAALMLAAFLAILNETVLSVALPQLMVDFHVDATVAQWLTTGFLLTMAIVIPTTGFLLRRVTRRTLFLIAMVFFLVGTALAAAATGFGMMLGARIVQAIGTAILLPLLMSTTLLLVAPERRGVMLGLNQVVISVGPAVGPTLAGVVMHALDWRWIFLLMLPLGVAILAFGAVAVRVPSVTVKAPRDVWSVVLSAFGFGGVVYALASLGAIMAGSWTGVVVGVVGIIALVLFVLRQRSLAARGREPLLDLRPLGTAVFRRSVVVIAIAFGTMIGSVVVLPIYLQDGRGLDVLATGLLLLPAGVAQAVAAPIFGALFDRFGSAPLLIPGAVLLTAGQFALASTGQDTPLALIVVFHVVFTLGMGAVMTALMTGSLGSLPPAQFGHGSAIVNTVQQLAGAAGTALLVAALGFGGAGITPPGAAVTAGAQSAFLVGGILTAIGLVIALTIRIRPVARS